MIQIKGLNKTYKSKTQVKVEALKNLTLCLPDKGFVFILGKSGSGKSTLLNLLGGLDSFDEGDIVFDELSYASLKQNQLDQVRNTLIGFVFQSYNILPDLSVGANILLADELQGKKVDLNKLNNILSSLDIKEYATRKPSELSGGQLQRVAIARTLMKDSRLLLADEPTGALDTETGKRIFEVLKEASNKCLVLCVSHNEDLAKTYADRIITLEDGKIINDIETNDNNSYVYNEQITYINNKITFKKDTSLSLEEFKKIEKEIEEYKTSNKKKDITKELVYGKNTKPKLISSKLSYKNSLIFALSSLKVKPFRFVLAVLLSFISFTLFGLSIVMADYDSFTATVESIPNTVDYVSIKKNNIYQMGENEVSKLTALSENDLIKLKELSNVTLKGVYKDNLELDFTSSVYDKTKIDKNYYTETLSGLSVLTNEDITNLGYKLYGNLPINKNEIVITKYTFDHFLAGGIINNNDKSYTLGEEVNKDNILGKIIRLDDEDYIITGVLDTLLDMNRYGYLLNGEGDPETFTYSEFRTLKINSYMNIGFISLNKMEELLALKNEQEPNIKRYGELSAEYQYTALGKQDKASISFTSIKENCNDIKVYGSKTIKQDELIINWYDYYTYLNNLNVLKEKTIDITYKENNYKNLDELFDNLSKEEFKTFGEEYLNDLFNQYKGFKVNVTFFSNYINQISMTTLNSLNVVGVYYNDNINENYGISPYLYKEVTSRLGGLYDFAIGNMPQEKKDITKVMQINEEKYDNVKYTITNQVTETVSALTRFVDTLVAVFKYIGIGFAIFAILMLYNFLSTSIYYKHKDIGILRALGARKQNVFMIFFNESLILALINAFLACISIGITSIIINNSIKDTYNVLVNVLNVNILHLLLILLLSVLASFIASFFPINKITKTMPLDTLKD